MAIEKKVDKIFLGIVIALMVIGILVFVSASLGVLSKNESKFWGVLFNQIVLGVICGSIIMFVCYKIDYKFWRKWSFIIFIISIILTLLVFIPGLGFKHGGAQRWLSLGPVSLQPAEFLKIGFVIYFAAWLSWIKHRKQDFKFSVIPLLILLAIIAIILLKQPDTKSFILILITGCAMLFASGIPWKYIIGIILVSAIGLISLMMFTPYLKDRMQTFLDPGRDITGSSYQLNQSMIALGSGGLFGRGYGQSIQKFSYLPEPQGDSIFAVVGEEFGFVGSTILILLFLAFALRGLRIASRSPDLFSRLLVTGIVIILTAQSFLNIASIIGVFPLTGVPLVFISHGGTSLLLALASIGMILNISKQQKKVTTND